MTAEKAKRRLDDLTRAIAQLEEALAVDPSAPLAIDGTIQRFEFVFELTWKAIKALLELEAPSADAGTPRAAVKSAYAAGWIGDEEAWLRLLEMRNATSHTYHEALAKEVYGRIKACAPMLRTALVQLQSRLT